MAVGSSARGSRVGTWSARPDGRDRSGRSVDVADYGLEAVLGHEGVEVVEEGRQVFGWGLFEGGEAFAEVAVGGAERSAGCFVDEQVVAGHVESFGDAYDDVG